jgi:hypothetical protein
MQATLLTTNNRNGKIINRLRDKVLEEQHTATTAQERATALEVELLSAGSVSEQQAAQAADEVRLPPPSEQQVGCPSEQLTGCSLVY